MKKKTKIALCCAILAALNIACEKKDAEVSVMRDPVAHTAPQMIHITYSIDGTTYSVSLVGVEQMQNLFQQLINLTLEGHHVSVRNKNVFTDSYSKESVHYTTNNQQELILWMTTMFNHGYSVSVDFNEATGEYYAVAVR